MPTNAYLDGWFTHKSEMEHPRLGGMPDNPFNPQTQPRSNQQWTSGWCDRYAAVKRGGFLEHDEKASTADENAGQSGPGKSVSAIREKPNTEAGDDLPAGRPHVDAWIAEWLTKRDESYPFCDTAACPWWRGYCSRDPACNN